MIHELKTLADFRWDIIHNRKTFEVRKNDRNFQVDDILLLKFWNDELKQYTGDEAKAEVLYVLHGGKFGIEEGYCVMGIKVLNYNF